MKENKVIFDVQRTLSSDKISERYNEREVFKNFAKLTGKHLCWRKNATLLKGDSNTGVFYEYCKSFKEKDVF